jgi:hypothetical protein
MKVGNRLTFVIDRQKRVSQGHSWRFVTHKFRPRLDIGSVHREPRTETMPFMPLAA